MRSPSASCRPSSPRLDALVVVFWALLGVSVGVGVGVSSWSSSWTTPNPRGGLSARYPPRIPPRAVFGKFQGNAAAAFESSLGSFLGDTPKVMNAADTWWNEVRFLARPPGPREDDDDDSGDDAGGDPGLAVQDAPADGHVLNGLAKALIGKMMGSFLSKDFLRHLGPWEGKELRVGTYCSGSDIAVKALEAVSAVLETDHHIKIRIKHVLSVESDPARRRFILSASPEVNVLLGDVTEFATSNTSFHNYATGKDWR